MIVALAALSIPLCAQVVITGRVSMKYPPGTQDRMWLKAIYTFGSLSGPGNQATGARTWETYPEGWYRLSGGAGPYI
jgi:hypothetical protein